VLPVKFDGGLSILFLRNKQRFEKNGRQKFAFSNSSALSQMTSRVRQTYDEMEIFIRTRGKRTNKQIQCVYNDYE
jgi:hypothetical protein